MSDQDPSPRATQTEEIFQVPKDTTPTWEVELLLSGALVFAMLQLPGLLDSAVYSLQPRLGGQMLSAAFMLYFYLKITAYALIVTFMLHLASRALWVAALGLRSVYPEGVLWEKLKRGPIFRAYAQQVLPTLDQMIDQADNRASKVFAIGLMLALMSLAIMVSTMLLVAVIGLLSAWLNEGRASPWLIVVLVLVWVLPVVLTTLIDRHYGERIARGGWLERVIQRGYALGWLMVWGRLTNPLMLTVFSRVGVGRGNLLLAGTMYLLMGVILVEVMLRTGVLSMPGERYLPESAPGREIRAAWYADSRSEDEALLGQPYIPAPLVREPYLRLFVPYLSRRLDDAIERDCPAATVEIAKDQPKVARKAAEAERTAALLDCAATFLHPVTIDGAPVRLRYELGKDPLSGLRGFVAMIPVRELGPGRYQLAIARPQLPDEEEAHEPVVIPFWR